MPCGFSMRCLESLENYLSMVPGHGLEECVEKELDIMGLSIGDGMGVVAVSTSYIKFVRMF